MRRLFTVLFLFLTVGAASAQPGSNTNKQGQEVSELGTQVKEKAELAVSQFQQRAGGRLDYSEASLAVVEEMLEEASHYRDQMPAKDINALVDLFAGHRGQVLPFAFCHIEREQRGGHQGQVLPFATWPARPDRLDFSHAWWSNG